AVAGRARICRHRRAQDADRRRLPRGRAAVRAHFAIESNDMSDSSYPGDLRLSIPADAVFIAVAPDVARRFAEFVGAAPSAAADLGAAVERLASHMHGRQID